MSGSEWISPGTGVVLNNLHILQYRCKTNAIPASPLTRASSDLASVEGLDTLIASKTKEFCGRSETGIEPDDSSKRTNANGDYWAVDLVGHIGRDQYEDPLKVWPCYPSK